MEISQERIKLVRSSVLRRDATERKGEERERERRVVADLIGSVANELSRIESKGCPRARATVIDDS